MQPIKILPAGDRALVVEFGNSIDEETNDKVHALAKNLRETGNPAIEEMIPTFRSLMICYDPLQTSWQTLEHQIHLLLESPCSRETHSSRILEIPCCYGSHFGPDLPDLEKHSGLTRDEIIAIHSSVTYKVYMLGFLPGFVYLGGLDKRIEMPRLATPRVRIPRGAVGIGGSQTGVYPLDSPGGWRLIGATPVDFYDPERQEPVLCKAGDYIRFVPISSCDYYDIRQMLQHGEYVTPIQTL